MQPRHEKIVDFEQQTQTVSLVAQFRLEALRIVEVDGVVHGEGHVRRDLFHERHGVGGITVRVRRCRGRGPRRAGARWSEGASW